MNESTQKSNSNEHNAAPSLDREVIDAAIAYVGPVPLELLASRGEVPLVGRFASPEWTRLVEAIAAYKGAARG